METTFGDQLSGVCACCRRCPVCGHYLPLAQQGPAPVPPVAPAPPSVPGTTTWPFRPYVPTYPGVTFSTMPPTTEVVGRPGVDLLYKSR